MEFSVIDLHCDLLSYLQLDSKRTAYDPASRCAISQMHQGQVKLQVMAIFTETEKTSVEKGLKQIKLYQTLPFQYSKELQHFSSKSFPSSSTAVLLAFENASGFCAENELLSLGIERLERMIQNNLKPLYISLTWNTENRFGGGASTNIGLKRDGKYLLEKLHQTQIAIDLSHASDALAYDIIDYIDYQSLNIPIIASHSNARVIKDVPRNLPNEIAKEIFHRNGIIGLNLFRPFIGERQEDLLKHVMHWLELGGENQIAFGADFFCSTDVPSYTKYGSQIYFKDYQNAACYGQLLYFLQKELHLSAELIHKISSQNALAFINQYYFGKSAA